MALKGPAPTPFVVRAMNGDTRKVGANKFQAQLDTAFDLPAGLPNPPAKLGPVARRHWRALATAKGAEALFREVDLGTLAGACVMFQGFMASAEAEDWYKAAKLVKAYNDCGDRLGLSGSARARLSIPKPVEEDPIEAGLCM